MKPLPIVICAALLLPSIVLLGQDGHYWSENYGNKSMLLSGTVNASVEDLGAVFYNPARLGMIENPAFAISAQVYEWRTLKAEDNEQGIKLNNSSFGGAPSLAAGTFKIPFLKNHRFAYSFLTRQRTKLDYFARIEREGDLIEGLPGEHDIFNGSLDVKTNFKEEWIGLTWAPPSSKKIGVGLSTFISTLNKGNLISVDMNALNEFDQAAYYSVNRKYGYDSYGLLWKLGLVWELEKVRFGLTITTPRINVYGSGSTLIEDHLVGVDTTGDGMVDDGYIFNIQENLNLRHRTPWAIGFGMGIPFSKGLVHLSAEWYDRISKYDILKIEPFIGQSTGDTIRFALEERLESVLNYGIGIEWHFNEKLSAYGSFASNYSAVPDNINRLSDFKESTNNSIFQADFFQFGGGFAISTKAIEITIGATYTGASNTFKNEIDFPEDGEDNVDGSSLSRLTFSHWKFILGFSFPFADKLTKNFEGE